MASTVNLKLKPEDKKFIADCINRVIGVLQRVKGEVDSDKSTEITIRQVSAAKGAISRVGREIVNRGVFTNANISKYSKQEIEEALKLIFSLD